MFSRKIERYIGVHQKYQISDLPQGCGYSEYPADPVDSANLFSGRIEKYLGVH